MVLVASQRSWSTPGVHHASMIMLACACEGWSPIASQRLGVTSGVHRLSL